MQFAIQSHRESEANTKTHSIGTSAGPYFNGISNALVVAFILRLVNALINARKPKSTTVFLMSFLMH